MTGLPSPVAARPRHRLRREARRRLGQQQHHRREPGRDQRAQRPSRDAQGNARPLGLGAPHSPPRSRAHGGDQEPTGQAAADRRLGQRHIGGGEPHPDDRQQQPVGDKTDDGGECVARGDRPQGDGENGESKARVQGQVEGQPAARPRTSVDHRQRYPPAAGGLTPTAGRGPRRTARAISRATMAPAKRVRSQAATSFSATNDPSA